MKKKLTFPYALQQIMLWAMYGCLFSYANPYLTEQLELSDSRAGIVLGLATGLSFLLQPALAAIVDRSSLDARKICIFAASVEGLSCLAVVLFPRGATLFFALSCVTLQVLPSFSNAMGMEAMRNGREINFAVARGIGSVSFGLSAKVMALMTHHWGNQSVPLGGAVIALLFVLMTLVFPSMDKGEKQPISDSGAPGFFRREPRFLLLIIASVLLYVGHNALCNCMFRVAQSKLSPDAIDQATTLQGSALLIAAIAELPTMFLFTRMLRRVRCDIWLCLSCVFMTLRTLLTWLLPGETGLLLTQLTQMGGYALYAVASVYYVGTVVQKADVVKGQTYLGASNTLGCLIAYVVGGVLIDQLGTGAMLATCLCLSTTGTILMLPACQRVEKAVGI